MASGNSPRMGWKQRADDYQQRHRKTGIGLATVKKYSEDESSNLAAMIAFWAFFSIFPLLLALVTILGYVLPAGTRVTVLQHVASYFPLLDASTLHGLTGSWWPVLIGLLTALWSGMSVTKTTEQAFNSVWEIKMVDRPGFADKLKHSLLALGTIGVGFVVSVILSGFVTGTASGVGLGWWARVLGYAFAIALDIGLFIAAFRLLTAKDVAVRDVLPGAVLAGVTFWILQEISSFIISNRLHSAQGTYGNFATVIVMLWWFYLQAQITLLGAQLNVVVKERLYPRSLFGGPSTEADRRALEAYAEEATYHEREEIGVDFNDDEGRQRPGRPPARPAGSAGDRR
jgi:YihY family inner membrane protein